MVMAAALISGTSNAEAPPSTTKPSAVAENPKSKKQSPAASERKTAEKPAPSTRSAGTFEVTAYTAGPESTGKRPGDAGYGITASGKTVQEGVTAACPPDLSFGTVLRIEGIGERVCHDRGGAIKGKRLDVYMSSLSDAREFGRKRLEVEIIEEVE